MTADDLLLPDAARLVHIGPHKTGTSSLQSAFQVARSELGRHGVVYGSATRNPDLAAFAVAGHKSMRGQRPPRPADWTELVEAVAAAGAQRVVVSSEYFADCEDGAMRRVVAELGGPRVHVVVTLRPLASLSV